MSGISRSLDDSRHFVPGINDEIGLLAKRANDGAIEFNVFHPIINRNQNFILLWKFNWFENRLDAYYVKYKYIHNIENFFFLLIQKIIRVIAVQKKKKEKESIERNIEKYWSMHEFDNLYTFKIDK